MKKTALYNKHIELGAKMVPFADYLMPVQYSGVNSEHINVRKGVGVFDVSHMGEFLVKGEDALSFIQKISSMMLLSYFLAELSTLICPMKMEVL